MVSTRETGRMLMVTGGFILSALGGLLFAQKESPTPDVDYKGTLLVQMRVADLDKAIAFYRDALGFQLLLRIDSLNWAELGFGADNVKIGIGTGGEVKGSGSVSLNIGVRDLDSARRALEQRGVKFNAPTVTIPDKVKLADFADPDGNRIRLAESLSSASGRQ